MYHILCFSTLSPPFPSTVFSRLLYNSSHPSFLLPNTTSSPSHHRPYYAPYSFFPPFLPFLSLFPLVPPFLLSFHNPNVMTSPPIAQTPPPPPSRLLSSPLPHRSSPFPVSSDPLLASTRARICKRLWSPGIESEKSIPPAYVAWRAGTRIRVVVPARQAGNRFLDSLKGLQIRAQSYYSSQH
jgi:hypothetical protein